MAENLKKETIKYESSIFDVIEAFRYSNNDNDRLDTLMTSIETFIQDKSINWEVFRGTSKKTPFLYACFIFPYTPLLKRLADVCITSDVDEYGYNGIHNVVINNQYNTMYGKIMFSCAGRPSVVPIHKQYIVDSLIFLIENQCININAISNKNVGMNTPLDIGIIGGDKDITRILLDHDADTKFSDNKLVVEWRLDNNHNADKKKNEKRAKPCKE